jgi:hypothetical protein
LLAEAHDLDGRGWKVDALETPTSVEHRRDLYADFDRHERCRVITTLSRGRPKYNLIVVTHVLEFIESVADRAELLSRLSERLRPSGRMLISLRGWSDVRAAKTQSPRGDGIITGLGTWTRGFTVTEACELLASASLMVEQTPHPKSTTPEQVRLICRKT